MTTTILVFILSFVGLSLMIGAKIFQLKVRKIDFLHTLSSRSDARIHDALAFLVRKYTLYKKIARLFVFDFLPSYLYELLVKAKDYVSKKYYQFGTEFQGRRVLRNTGSVSFFLKRLAEEKPER